MSENSLVPQDAMLPANYVSDAFEKDLEKSKFLTRIQLCGSSTEAAKLGQVPVNHWGHIRSKEEADDLGKEINVLLIAWRATGINLNAPEGVYINHNPESARFREIQALSEANGSSAFWGPEYLVWVPQLGTFNTLGLFSDTARRVHSEFKALLGQAVTLKHRMIKGKKHTWPAPVVVPCSIPLSPVPDEAEINLQSQIFRNPPEDNSKNEGEPAAPEQTIDR